MDILYADHIKHRLIPFSKLHPDKNQARTAALFLADLEGILRAEPVSGNALRVSYGVLITTLVEIEEAISDFGLHLDHKLRYRLKRVVCHYTEETQRANCVCPGDINTGMTDNIGFPESMDFELMPRIMSLTGAKGPEVVAGLIAMLVS